MIQIILVRHGERKQGKDDRNQPLTEPATKQAEKFGKKLFELCLPPSQVLTSSHKHARQTAESIVRGAGLDPSLIRDAPSLTSGSESSATNHWIDDQLYADLQQTAIDLAPVILLVGHEPRLSQLILRFTSERRRSLEALEGACIQADDWKDLWLGRGKVTSRYPVRNWLDEELAEKIASKMTVATFLASANFIGMMELLIGQREILKFKSDSASLWTPDCDPAVPASYCQYLLLYEPSFLLGWAALFAQFLAAGLFIASVYLYDRLTMPSGFWQLKRPWWIGRDDKSQDKLLLHGHLQAHMVHVWSVVFTPAVVLSALGVLLLVAATGIGMFLALSILTSLGVALYFRCNRPTGDID